MNGNVKQKHLIYEYPTITEMLDRTSIDRHDQLLFIEEKRNGRQVTVGRWRQDLLETAGRFQRHNAKHIGVVCDLTYECILCMYGAIMAGKVLVPLEGDLSGEALEWYVKKADVELLLYHDGMIDGDVTGCESMQMPDFLAIYAENPANSCEKCRDTGVYSADTCISRATDRRVCLSAGPFAAAPQSPARW